MREGKEDANGEGVCPKLMIYLSKNVTKSFALYPEHTLIKFLKYVMP